MGGEPVFFETAVRPILKAACFHCHGEDGEREGGLDLRLVRLMVAGGESGAAVQPGDPEGSHLWRKVAADEMPKSGKKLAAEDKEVIRNWIAQGAKTARPEPEDPGEARFTLEELSHWAFQPVAAVEPPEGTGEAGPIDAFVAARLGEAGLGFSEPAERRTLIRRLSFDLTGLPPAPEEVEGFVNDSAPEAWERVVDHYLASPQFGVRWARHWLDAAGYAESDGHAPDDAKRPHA